MCGIAGIISTKPIDSIVIDRMVDTLLQRGPDARGKYINDSATVLLGHTRLSIIDLNDVANQPIFSRSGRYIIVYNGEIYNYKSIRNTLQQEHNVLFKTHSDTEVLIEAFEVWGPQVATRLEGMFAFAIYDTANHQLFLLRDRLGKKPLFYYQSESMIAFASEIKSLVQIPAIKSSLSVNSTAISHFCHLGYIPDGDTIYKEIKKFPAATYSYQGIKKLEFNKYWDAFDCIKPIEASKEQQARHSFHELLNSAVQKRLIGDVPIGSFLSGGTDSSLITALATRQLGQKIKTFSIGFKDRRFDEADYARHVAKHLNTDHHEFILEERQAIEILPQYLNYFDEPFADTSAIPMMMISMHARKDVKVVLTGDGGDELFHGYGSHRWAERLNTFPFRLGRDLMSKILHVSGRSRMQRVAHLVERHRIGSERSHIFSQEQYNFSQHEIRDKILKHKEQFEPFLYSDVTLDGSTSAAEKQARFDLNSYLRDDLLVKVDRASMHYGLECRCPLLDDKVVEFALSLPPSLKRRNNISKWLMKDLLANFLPADLVHRPKWGFSVPMSSWLRGELRYLIEDYLSKQALEETDLFNVQEVMSLVDQFDRGKDYLYQRLWLLIVLQRWFKLNVSAH